MVGCSVDGGRREMLILRLFGVKKMMMVHKTGHDKIKKNVRIVAIFIDPANPYNWLTVITPPDKDQFLFDDVLIQFL